MLGLMTKIASSCNGIERVSLDINECSLAVRLDEDHLPRTKDGRIITHFVYSLHGIKGVAIDRSLVDLTAIKGVQTEDDGMVQATNICYDLIAKDLKVRPAIILGAINAAAVFNKASPK